MSQFLIALVRSEGKSCAGKIKYPREDSAARNALALSEKPEKKALGEVFEYYPCEFCQGWHIGHRTNFDWIPESHRAYSLLIIRYHCEACDTYHYTNTVFSNRILDHFPTMELGPEAHLKCRACKETEKIRFIAQAWVPLADIPEDSTESLESLWGRFWHEPVLLVDPTEFFG